jgi:hypothetical protein
MSYQSSYSPYSVTLGRVYYTSIMADWAKALPDVHWVYGMGYVTLYFSREEDLVAFKLRFGI